MIEAKRFNLPKRKIKSVGEDIERIDYLFEHRNEEFGKRLENIRDYKFRGKILADVWTQNERKRQIEKAFEENRFIEAFLPDLIKKYPTQKYQYNVAGFRETEVDKVIRENYFLLYVEWDLI